MSECLLFESVKLPLQFWLETVDSGSSLSRRDSQALEEICCFEPASQHGALLNGTYLCLPPGVEAPPLRLEHRSRLLRVLMTRQREPHTGSGRPSLSGKPYVGPVHFSRLPWTEIPSRRPFDPGGRVAELSRDAAGFRITTLMECRPGWILDEHDHPSDVVTYCLRGEGQLRIEQRTASYLAGELVAIPARTPHWFQSGEAGALLIIFVFEPSII